MLDAVVFGASVSTLVSSRPRLPTLPSRTGPRRLPPPRALRFSSRAGAPGVLLILLLIRASFALVASPTIRSALALDNAFVAVNASSLPRTARPLVTANAPTTLRLAIAIHRPRPRPRVVVVGASSRASSREDEDASKPARSARDVSIERRLRRRRRRVRKDTRTNRFGLVLSRDTRVF